MIGNRRLPLPVPSAIPLLVMALSAVIGMLALPAAIGGAADNVCSAPYDPVVNPTDFKDVQGKPNPINNPWFPLRPGTIYRYALEDGSERVEVRVTHQTKTILGVTTTVVRDEVTVNGKVEELTFDWFAQHDDGTVWYFGEDSSDPVGSWEAGKNGAKPGIIMKANPKVGDTYRQEYGPGVAEDAAEVKDLDADVTVPFGSYGNALKTQDFTCLRGGTTEFKYYAPGVGLVLETARGGKDRLELISVTKPGG